MLVSDFDYELPEELIAQSPVEPRHNSRLLAMDVVTGSFWDHYFYELPSFLKPGDLLIFNDTRVIPARLYAEKIGSGARVEIFLLKALGLNRWEALVWPGKKVKPGCRLGFGDGVLAEVAGIVEGGVRVIQFPAGLDFPSWLATHGETPLPPYITRKLEDAERYQTVYAKHEGSVAAPTAGLHFTPELLGELQSKGVQFGYLTLHVGVGTFRPVKTKEVEEHTMHPERFVLGEELARRISETKKAGGRVIAVGTTVVRVLESQALKNGELRVGEGETSIFIYPGYNFRVIEGLITNFHLPKSTLLMLVSAFAGREKILAAYRHAIEERYRFFSFGDAMLIADLGD
ncbi:MAG: tRNA preQ1(34) S-adenosylmethionine ribosyltransferase-isomerase QueA [Firmicutes bacterium]|nr:tRNA preQ1(34) S-adenosylmethionine ribosyltransferase-isomerase QueA [Bacillota bacterium]